ncbi:stAR-related lipid transfer protein 9 [Pelodytes ibericus]
MANVRVALRVRPPSKRENSEGSRIILNVDENVARIRNVKPDYKQDGCSETRERLMEFGFDYCYWSVDADDPKYASQEVVFQDLGTSVLSEAIKGYNVCLFAYGQTGSGKTYTMMGTPTSVGLTPRICEGLFSFDDGSPGSPSSCRIEVSFLEIYNERVRDLLNPSIQTRPYSLRVREHPEKGPYVQGLSQHVVTDYEQVAALLEEGMENRITAATHIHDASSRSHAIFTIQYTQAMLEDDLPSEIASKINLVDLAGSERASPDYCKDRLTEGSNINRSLVTLGIVISALAQNSQMNSSCQSINSIVSDWDSGSPGSMSGSKRQPYVPYRDSILTWLLKDSLGGNSKTVMIATVSPASSSYNETMSTLRYASNAKNIVNKPRVNEDANVKLIRDLREEINRLKLMLRSFEMRTSSPSFSEERDGNLTELVLQNELKIEQLTKDWTEKWTDKAAIMEQYKVDISQGKAGVTIDSDLPHLIALHDDILSTGVVIYHLREGITHIGRENSDRDHDIVLPGDRMENQHCMIDNSAGVVEFRPVAGALCMVNGQEVTEACRLSQGAILVLGKTHRFRFNHPAEAAILRQQRSDSQASFVSSGSLDWLDLSGDLSSTSCNGNPVSLNGRELDPPTEEYRQKLKNLEAFYQERVEEQQRYVLDLKRQIQSSQIRGEKELEQEQSLINQLVKENQQWLAKEEQRWTVAHQQRRETAAQTESKTYSEAEVQNSLPAEELQPSPAEQDRKRLVQLELLRKCSLRRLERNIKRKTVKFQLERIAKKQKLLEAKKKLQQLEAVCWISEDIVKQTPSQVPNSPEPTKEGALGRSKSSPSGFAYYRRGSLPWALPSLLSHSAPLKRKGKVAINGTKPDVDGKPRRSVSIECLPKTPSGFEYMQEAAVTGTTPKVADKRSFGSLTNLKAGASCSGTLVENNAQMSKKRPKMDKAGNSSKGGLPNSRHTEPPKKRNALLPVNVGARETKPKSWKSSSQPAAGTLKKVCVLDKSRLPQKKEGTKPPVERPTKNEGTKSPVERPTRNEGTKSPVERPTKNEGTKSPVERPTKNERTKSPVERPTKIVKKPPLGKPPTTRSSPAAKMAKPLTESRSRLPAKKSTTGNTSSSVDDINKLSGSGPSGTKWKSSERLASGLVKPIKALLENYKEDEESDSSDSESFYSVDSLSSAYASALNEQLKMEEMSMNKPATDQKHSDSEDSQMSQDSLMERENRKFRPNKRRFHKYKTILAPCNSSQASNNAQTMDPVVLAGSLTSGISKSFSLDSLADADDVLEADSAEELPAEIFWKLQSPRCLISHTRDQSNVDSTEGSNDSTLDNMSSSFYLNMKPDSYSDNTNTSLVNSTEDCPGTTANLSGVEAVPPDSTSPLVIVNAEGAPNGSKRQGNRLVGPDLVEGFKDPKVVLNLPLSKGEVSSSETTAALSIQPIQNTESVKMIPQANVGTEKNETNHELQNQEPQEYVRKQLTMEKPGHFCDNASIAIYFDFREVQKQRFSDSKFVSPEEQSSRSVLEQSRVNHAEPQRSITMIEAVSEETHFGNGKGDCMTSEKMTKVEKTQGEHASKDTRNKSAETQIAHGGESRPDLEVYREDMGTEEYLLKNHLELVSQPLTVNAVDTDKFPNAPLLTTNQDLEENVCQGHYCNDFPSDIPISCYQKMQCEANEEMPSLPTTQGDIEMCHCIDDTTVEISDEREITEEAAALKAVCGLLDNLHNTEQWQDSSRTKSVPCNTVKPSHGRQAVQDNLFGIKIELCNETETNLAEKAIPCNSDISMPQNPALMSESELDNNNKRESSDHLQEPDCPPETEVDTDPDRSDNLQNDNPGRIVQRRVLGQQNGTASNHDPSLIRDSAICMISKTSLLQDNHSFLLKDTGVSMQMKNNPWPADMERATDTSSINSYDHLDISARNKGASLQATGFLDAPIITEGTGRPQPARRDTCSTAASRLAQEVFNGNTHPASPTLSRSSLATRNILPSLPPEKAAQKENSYAEHQGSIKRIENVLEESLFTEGIGDCMTSVMVTEVAVQGNKIENSADAHIHSVDHRYGFLAGHILEDTAVIPLSGLLPPKEPMDGNLRVLCSDEQDIMHLQEKSILVEGFSGMATMQMDVDSAASCKLFNKAIYNEENGSAEILGEAEVLANNETSLVRPWTHDPEEEVLTTVPKLPKTEQLNAKRSPARTYLPDKISAFYCKNNDASGLVSETHSAPADKTSSVVNARHVNTERTSHGINANRICSGGGANPEWATCGFHDITAMDGPCKYSLAIDHENLAVGYDEAGTQSCHTSKYKKEEHFKVEVSDIDHKEDSQPHGASCMLPRQNPSPQINDKPDTSHYNRGATERARVQRTLRNSTGSQNDLGDGSDGSSVNYNDPTEHIGNLYLGINAPQSRTLHENHGQADFPRVEDMRGAGLVLPYYEAIMQHELFCESGVGVDKNRGSVPRNKQRGTLKSDRTPPQASKIEPENELMASTHCSTNQLQGNGRSVDPVDENFTEILVVELIMSEPACLESEGSDIKSLREPQTLVRLASLESAGQTSTAVTKLHTTSLGQSEDGTIRQNPENERRSSTERKLKHFRSDEIKKRLVTDVNENTTCCDAIDHNVPSSLSPNEVYRLENRAENPWVSQKVNESSMENQSAFRLNMDSCLVEKETRMKDNQQSAFQLQESGSHYTSGMPNFNLSHPISGSSLPVNLCKSLEAIAQCNEHLTEEEQLGKGNKVVQESDNCDNRNIGRPLASGFGNLTKDMPPSKHPGSSHGIYSPALFKDFGDVNQRLVKTGNGSFSVAITNDDEQERNQKVLQDEDLFTVVDVFNANIVDNVPFTKTKLNDMAAHVLAKQNTIMEGNDVQRRVISEECSMDGLVATEHTQRATSLAVSDGLLVEGRWVDAGYIKDDDQMDTSVDNDRNEGGDINMPSEQSVHIITDLPASFKEVGTDAFHPSFITNQDTEYPMLMAPTNGTNCENAPPPISESVTARSVRPPPNNLDGVFNIGSGLYTEEYHPGTPHGPHQNISPSQPSKRSDSPQPTANEEDTWFDRKIDTVKYLGKTLKSKHTGNTMHEFAQQGAKPDNTESLHFPSSDINPFVHTWQCEEHAKGWRRQHAFNSASDVSLTKLPTRLDAEKIMRCSSVDEGLNTHNSPFHSHLSSYANARRMSSTLSSIEGPQVADDPAQDFKSARSLDGSQHYYYPVCDEDTADDASPVNERYGSTGRCDNDSVQVDEIVLLYTSDSETCDERDLRIRWEQGTQTKDRSRRLNRHQRSHTDVSSAKQSRSRHQYPRPASWSSVQNMSMHLSQLLHETSELLGNLTQNRAENFRFEAVDPQGATRIKRVVRDSSTQTTADVGIQTDQQTSHQTQGRVSENQGQEHEISLKASQVNVIVKVMGRASPPPPNSHLEVTNVHPKTKTQSLPDLHDLDPSDKSQRRLCRSAHGRTSSSFLDNSQVGHSETSLPPPTRGSHASFSDVSSPSSNTSQTASYHVGQTFRLKKPNQKLIRPENSTMVDRASSPILTLRASKKSLDKVIPDHDLTSQNTGKLLRHRRKKDGAVHEPQVDNSSQTETDSECDSFRGHSRTVNATGHVSSLSLREQSGRRISEGKNSVRRSISEASVIGRPSTRANSFTLSRRDKADGTSATALNSQHPNVASPPWERPQSLENLAEFPQPLTTSQASSTVPSKQSCKDEVDCTSFTVTSIKSLSRNISYPFSASDVSGFKFRSPDDGESIVESECNTDVLLNPDSSTRVSHTAQNYTLEDLPLHNKFSNWSGVQCTPPRAESLIRSSADFSVRESPAKTEGSPACESRIKEIERLQRERAEVMSGIHLELNPQPLTVQLAEAKLSYGIGETDALLRVIQNVKLDSQDTVSIKKQLYERHMKVIESLRQEREERLQSVQRSRSLSPQKQLSSSQGSLASLRDTDSPSRRREYLQQLRKDVVENTRIQEPRMTSQCPSEIELMLKDYQKAREEAKVEIARARDKLRERAELEKKRLQLSGRPKDDIKLKTLMSTSTLFTNSSLSLSSGPTSGYNSSATYGRLDSQEAKISPKSVDFPSAPTRGRSTARNCHLLPPFPSVSLSVTRTPNEEAMAAESALVKADAGYSPPTSPLPPPTVSYQDFARLVQSHATAEIMASCTGNLKNLFNGQASSGWRYQCRDRDVFVYYKPFPSATKHGFLGAGIIKRSLHDIWCMIKDVTTRRLYDQTILSAQVHQRVSGGIQLVHVTSDTSLCYLKQPRDFCCISVESKQDSGHSLCFQSLYNESMPRAGKGTVRGEILPSAWILRSDSVNGEMITRVVYMVQVDLGAPAIPSRLLGVVMKRQPLVIANLAKFLSK